MALIPVDLSKKKKTDYDNNINENESKIRSITNTATTGALTAVEKHWG